MLLLGEFEGTSGKTLKLQAVIELEGIFKNIYIYIYIYRYRHRDNSYISYSHIIAVCSFIIILTSVATSLMHPDSI